MLRTYCIYVKHNNCSTRLQVSSTRKPSPTLMFAIVLVFIILTQEGLILFNMQSFGKTEETPWFRKWPFATKETEASPKTALEYASNESHVELVIGLHQERANNKELTVALAQEKSYVTNELSLNGKTRSIAVNVPKDRVSNLIENLMNNKDVEYLEPNWKIKTDAIPNDAGWLNQWGPLKIQATSAWDTQKGSKAVLVAVVDTGIYYTHPDLVANYVPLGYDWANNDTDPMDDNGHGTHCAGIIAATLNNSIGIAGLAQVRLMAEKGLDRTGSGYDDDLANAIVHAVNQGAKIISCSWGSDAESQIIHDAVKYATNAGALVVAAAGNSGTNTRHYPAAYPEVIAVTATDEGDDPALFTSYGDWVDIAAPGTSIYSTYLWNMYFSMSGTSMACPHVAGVAALVWSQYPAMTNEQVRNQLFYTADDLGAAGFDEYYGHGRVNARKAVAQTVSLTGSEIINAPANKVYFLYLNPAESTSMESSYDAIANGIVYGLATHSQKQGFTSDRHLVLESGELNSTTVINGTVVLLGGPCPQKTVGYYENAGLTPVKFAANATHDEFVTQSNQFIAGLTRAAADSGHEDMFVIEVLMDKGNLIVIMYGFTWKGTWASGIYFKDRISANLNAYSGKCYVFHWIDDTSYNGIPESNEIHQQYVAT